MDGGDDRAGIRSRIRRLRRSLCGQSWDENDGGSEGRRALDRRNEGAARTAGGTWRSLAEALAEEGQGRQFDIAGAGVERGSQSQRLTTRRGNGSEEMNSGAGGRRAENHQATLMQCLLKEMEIEKTKDEEAAEEEEEGRNPVCCVCMGRKKGAALIPCGHTYCRVCASQLWLRRGSCPLCNRAIADILTIY